ncbi:MAG: DNA primase, partial [Phycisphaerae bacterium]|nr:DNA primase [Phycisphaerae bacterium]
MALFFSEDILAEVARANDIVEVIAGYFPLKRAGKDYKALCPFHSEKTPSFTVSPSKQIFKCFGCGLGGGVFNFIAAKENVSFPEAVRILAERAGVKLPEQRGQRTETSLSRREIFRTLEWAAKWFAKWLRGPEGQGAREYLGKRGLDETGALGKYRLGLAPAGWDNLLKQAPKSNVSTELLLAAGLVVKRSDGSGYYDRFRGRLMFPIFDTLNRTVGFGGRILEGAGQQGDEPKYLNSPETAVFKKGEGLYGLPEARDAIEASRRAIVVEGYTDVLMAHQAGVENVVATLGTALTVEHIRVLRRFADEVVVVFDSDIAGQRAADRSLELFLAQDVNISVVTLPQGKDPFDFIKSEGKDRFIEITNSAQEALEYKWQLVQEEFEAASSIAGQRRALDAMLITLGQVPAFARPESSARRELLMQRISRALGISEAVLRDELARLRRRPREAPGRDQAAVDLGADGNIEDPRRGAIEKDLL